MRATFEQVVRDADLRARLKAGGGRLMAMPAREQRAFLRSEMQRCGETIKRHRVTAQ